MIIRCKKSDCLEKEDELHHIIPKYMGGTDKDGRVYLCLKHHEILQGMIPKIIFKYVPKEKVELLKQEIKDFTKYWLGEQTEIQTNEDID